MSLLRRGSSLAALTLFFGACALEPQTLVRTPRENVENGQEARAEQAGAGPRSVRRQRRDREASEEGKDGEDGPEEESEDGGQEEVASFEIDLTNFKDRLATLDAEELTEIMGTPEFERSEPPAQIWKYRTTICVVDVFLYDDDGDLVVEHVDLRGREEDTDEVDERACFASIIQDPNRAEGGGESLESSEDGDDSELTFEGGENDGEGEPAPDGAPEDP